MEYFLYAWIILSLLILVYMVLTRLFPSILYKIGYYKIDLYQWLVIRLLKRSSNHFIAEICLQSTVYILTDKFTNDPSNREGKFWLEVNKSFRENYDHSQDFDDFILNITEEFYC